MTPFEFWDALRAYCAITSASVTSYGRTPTHNVKVKGVFDSPHLWWLGADVVYDAELNPTRREAIARRLNLRCLIEGDHDHLQPWEWRA